jgi:chromosome partitioning protein
MPLGRYALRRFGGTALRPQGRKAVRRMHVLAIVNQKGGVGKTNVAANLGACLAARGRRVVAIDADPQATLTKMLLPTADAEAGTAAVFADDPPAAEDLLIEIPAFGLRLMPSDFDRLEGMQSTLQRDPTRLFGLAQAIAPLDERVDYVLIDCPPNYGQLTIAALYAATGVIVPIDCSREAVGGLGLLLRTLRRVERVNHVPIATVVATAYKAGNTFHPSIIAGVRDALSDAPLYTIRDAIDVQRAVSQNMPIRLFAPKNGAAADYEALAEALDAKLAGAPEVARA